MAKPEPAREEHLSRAEIAKAARHFGDRIMTLLEKLADATPPDGHPTISAELPTLSRREMDIIRTLGTATMLGRVIAKELDRDFTGSFTDKLGDMVRFGILINTPKLGYSVAQRFRHLVCDVTDEPEPDGDE